MEQTGEGFAKILIEALPIFRNIMARPWWSNTAATPWSIRS